jgi:hypothetical protein
MVPSWLLFSPARRRERVSGSIVTYSSHRCVHCAQSFRKRLTPWYEMAGLANIASNYLIAGKEAHRHGTAHPSIVPYQVFPCKDGFIMIGAGNDRQV